MRLSSISRADPDPRQSLAGNELRVANPFEERAPARIRDLTTGRVCAEGCGAGAILATATEIGHVYAVERTGMPLETIERQSLPNASGKS
jgi:hypothetical protein